MPLGYEQPPTYPLPEDRSGAQAGAREAPPTSVRSVPDGYQGTSEIIDEMRRLVLAAYQDERVNQLSRQVTITCPGHDYLCELRAVHAWFLTVFRYTRLPWHPDGFQRVQTPSYTLFDAPARTGECASLSTAMAAVLMSLGFEVKFRTVGSDAAAPLDFEHVYLVVNVPSYGWVAAEPSYDEPLGWEHPRVAVKQDWEIA